MQGSFPLLHLQGVLFHKKKRGQWEQLGFGGGGHIVGFGKWGGIHVGNAEVPGGYWLGK